jgi:peptidoglycan/xylan/chitin deacetylase (PgdA/CDA1 family)
LRILRIPSIVKALFPDLIWDLKNKQRKIYLTFDDGPVPDLTEYVLDVLDKHHAKATFFCVGRNVEKNKGIFRQIYGSGHTIGNHTYDHMNGWKAGNQEYFKSISLCEDVFRECGYYPQIKYFRPPYGKIRFSQIHKLKHEYTIVMWDLLIMDYNSSQTPDDCLELTIKHSKPGSIIVFHDSLKTENKIKFVLERLLTSLTDLDFQFCSLEDYFRSNNVN